MMGKGGFISSATKMIPVFDYIFPPPKKFQEFLCLPVFCFIFLNRRLDNWFFLISDENEENQVKPISSKKSKRKKEMDFAGSLKGNIVLTNSKRNQTGRLGPITC